ncbi:MAG: AAA family ATPase [Bacteroidales bacterium]|jgi:Predicted ATP-dependent serine protease|nr:AAA family ATPase [Bacteroidales bacterium]
MEKRVTLDNFKEIWESLLIRASDEFEIPPEVIRIEGTTISTLGNFSASTGKGKSRKSFNVSAIVASALTGRKVLNYEASFPEGKDRILYFDTEQSPDHCRTILRRINKLCGYPEKKDDDRIRFAFLRQETTLDRRDIIECALITEPNIGLVIIDGLRDLLFDINSSTEAAEVIGLLMRWSSQFNVHIHTVLHLNKGDDNLRGHIGTELNHKAETILQIKVSEEDENISEVSASMVRDRKFPPFAFSIDDEGVPVLEEDYEFDPKPKRESFNYKKMSEEKHRDALDKAFEGAAKVGYGELIDRLKVGYEAQGFGRSYAILSKLKTFLVENGMIIKENKKYLYNRDFHYVQDGSDQNGIVR